MSENKLDAFSMEDENRKRRNEIMRITPELVDPVVYWHQVAQDAIRTAEKERERTKLAVTERERAERDYKLLTERLVSEAADQRSRIPLDVSRLIDMAQTGSIDLNFSIYISKGGSD